VVDFTAETMVPRRQGGDQRVVFWLGAAGDRPLSRLATRLLTADMAEQSGIVWIASYPKSGNTWVRAFLHNLARLQKGEAGEQDINEMARFSTWDLDKRRYGEFLGFEPDNAIHRREIAATRHAVHRQIVDTTQGLIFIKTHNSLVMDRGHSTVNFDVTAGAIYVVRNPLDVAISYAHHSGASIDDAIHRLAMRDVETSGSDSAVYEVHGSWSQHVWSWTRSPHRALYIVRYEDMLADPDTAFAAVARHLLLEPTRRQLAKAIERSSFTRLQAQEKNYGFRERPPAADQNFFREGRAGQWKEILTPQQVDRVIRDHGEQMRRLGYLPLG
jgi:Sulfotransferase domain